MKERKENSIWTVVKSRIAINQQVVVVVVNPKFRIGSSLKSFSSEWVWSASAKHFVYIHVNILIMEQQDVFYNKAEFIETVIYVNRGILFSALHFQPLPTDLQQSSHITRLTIHHSISKNIFFSNPTLHRHLAPTGLTLQISRLFTGVPCLRFFFFFV